MAAIRRVLGIDPGFGRVGWGVIDVTRGEPKAIAAGCIETDPKAAFPARLATISKELRTIIQKFSPTEAAVEELFFAKNVTTGLQVAHARGVIVHTLYEAGLSIREFTPLQVKQAVVGYGKATKSQVQELVLVHLRIKKQRLQDDAADALAVAITAIPRAIES